MIETYQTSAVVVLISIQILEKSAISIESKAKGHLRKGFSERKDGVSPGMLRRPFFILKMNYRFFNMLKVDRIENP